MGLWASRSEDLIGGVKDALGGTLADGLALAPRLEQRLDVASAELRSGQTQRFAAKQCHGLSFHFANVGRCVLSVCEVAFATVEKRMGDLVEERLMREGRDRADRDLSAPLRVTLDVAVQVLKLGSLDIQRLKSLLFVPFRDDGRLVFLAFRLRENEPYR